MQKTKLSPGEELPTGKFQVGDKVCSSERSGDERAVGKKWHATIVEVRHPPQLPYEEHEGSYETLGWWAGDNRKRKPKLRRLWGIHLEPDSDS